MLTVKTEKNIETKGSFPLSPKVASQDAPEFARSPKTTNIMASVMFAMRSEPVEQS